MNIDKKYNNINQSKPVLVQLVCRVMNCENYSYGCNCKINAPAIIVNSNGSINCRNMKKFKDGVDDE